MNKFFSILLFFPVLLISLLVFTFTSYHKNSLYEMQEIMVIDAANSANDAAVREAQRIAHIDSYGKVTLNPSRVWEEYKRAFLRSINLFSDKNMDLFESYCPSTVIAVNDGYFIRMRTLDDEGEIIVAFSQKIPYARETDNESVVADTLNGSYIYGINAGVVRIWGDDAPLVSERGGIHDSPAIAAELMKAMDYCIEIENNSLTNSIWDSQSFYVPKEVADSVYYDSVSFEGLMLINLIQGFDLKGTTSIDCFTISNTQLIVTKQYACYTSSGKKYYSLLDESNTIEQAKKDIAETTVQTKMEAARLGYSPDPRYYQVPVPD